MPGHTGVPVGEETAPAIPLGVEEAEAAGLPASSSGVRVKAREASTGPRGRGRPRNEEYRLQPRVPPAGLSNSGGAPELPVLPPRPSRASSSGLAQGIRTGGEILAATGEVAAGAVGALGSVAGAGLSASASVIEGSAELAGAVAPPLFYATVGGVRVAARAVQTGYNVASGIRNMLIRGGRDESPIHRGTEITRVAFVAEDDVEAGIHTHVGTRRRQRSPVPDDRLEQARQSSLLEKAASEAACVSSRSESASKVASAARSSLASLEGSSSSASTSRASGTPQEHFDISSPKEQKKVKKRNQKQVLFQQREVLRQAL